MVLTAKQGIRRRVWAGTSNTPGPESGPCNVVATGQIFYLFSTAGEEAPVLP